MSVCDVYSMCVAKWSKECCASQSFQPKHFSCVGCVFVRYFIPKLYVLCEVHGLVYIVKLKKQLSIRCTVWHCTVGWCLNKGGGQEREWARESSDWEESKRGWTKLAVCVLDCSPVHVLHQYCGPHAALGNLNSLVIQFNRHNVTNRLTELLYMAPSLAEKMFRNCNSSHSAHSKPIFLYVIQSLVNSATLLFSHTSVICK